MRKFILLFVAFSSVNALAQKTTENFKGQMTFKETYYYQRITRLDYDTILNYLNYDIKRDSVFMEQIFSFSHQFENNFNFAPIKFTLRNDSIFYGYIDRYFNNDTVETLLFSLDKKDTISSIFCYRIGFDSLDGQCIGDDREVMTYRQQDTTITFKDYKIDCYVFEQKTDTTGRHKVFFTRKILVDKHTLIPIEVKEYNYNRPGLVRIRHEYQGRNLLTYHKRLLSI